MKKIIFSIFFFVIPFLLYAQKELSPKSTIITGRVLNHMANDPAVITFNYGDVLSNDDRKSVRLSPTKEFYSKFEMLFSQNITIQYGEEFLGVFLNLNDSLDITIDMNKLRLGDLNGIVFSGDGAKINNQFAKFCNYLLGIPNRELNFNIPPKEFLKEIKMDIAAKEDSIADYAKKNNLDLFIVNWAKRDIVYSLANRILYYSSNNIKQQLEVLTDSIFDINNQENFKSLMFQYHLMNILSPILKQDEGFVKLRDKDDIVNVTLAGVKALAKLPISTSRDYLIYFFMVEIQSAPELYKQLPENIFLNKIFYQRLNDLSLGYISTDIEIKPIEGISYLCKDSVKSVKTQNIFNYFAEKYDGKVIYIDIWNSGCGPCITQFEYVKELHKLYHEKDVVFVNICLTSTLDSWLKVINNNKVVGENYYLDSDNSALFMDMCKIPGYPTFMLMDKTGKLVDKAAPQPQNLSRIGKKIDNLLNLK